MKIRYTLHKYHFNGGNSYRARVKYNRVVELEELIAEMKLPFSGVTRAMVEGIFAEFARVVLRLLLEGCKIVTPFGVFGLTIKGQFKDELDRLDHRKQQFEITFKPDERMQKELVRKARPRKVEGKKPCPNPHSYLNLFDDSAANILTPGEMARLYGYHLKVDLTDPRQGIFLLPVKEGSRFERAGPPIRVERVGRNKGRELLFVVPDDLPPGAYVLEVRAVFGRNILRQGQFNQRLHVLPPEKGPLPE